MGFFVKDVENVQGDERDVIIFSTTFGRNEHGVFRKSFGALGQAGGERRLNVAVTRARKKVVMITSMPISEISDLLTTRRGPRVPRDYLQGYLEYARTVSEGAGDSGRTLLDRMVTEKSGNAISGITRRTALRNPSKASWKRKDELRQRRATAEHSPGFRGHRSSDGAVCDRVECDAPRHRLLEKAQAREVWRPNVLGRRYLISTGFGRTPGRVRGTPNVNASRKRSRMHFEAKEEFDERSESFRIVTRAEIMTICPTKPHPVENTPSRTGSSWPT